MGEQPDDLVVAAVDFLVEGFNTALKSVCLLLQPGEVLANHDRSDEKLSL
ncbi:hypothetical protein [Streptomyces sp. NPDC060333]